MKIPGGKPADPQNCTDRRPEVMQKCMARPCYTWNSTDWSECSRACGGGWQRRRSVCINTSTRETVSSYHCGNGRPQGGRKCNQHSCFAWKTTKFAACSRTCGGGLQHRRVECKSYAHGEVGSRSTLPYPPAPRLPSHCYPHRHQLDRMGGRGIVLVTRIRAVLQVLMLMVMVTMVMTMMLIMMTIMIMMRMMMMMMLMMKTMMVTVMMMTMMMTITMTMMLIMMMTMMMMTMMVMAMMMIMMMTMTMMLIMIIIIIIIIIIMTMITKMMMAMVTVMRVIVTMTMTMMMVIINNYSPKWR